MPDITNSERVAQGFTKRHGVRQLVYFEQHPTVAAAIQREKSIKRWPHVWKVRTIEKLNPTWIEP